MKNIADTLKKYFRDSRLLFIGALLVGLSAALFVANRLVTRAADKGIDADAVPAVSGTLGIGTGGFTWASVNELIYFNSTFVGVGAVPNARELEVVGGLRLNTSKPKPSCASGVVGLWWYSANASGTKDSLEVCAKNASGTYAWRTIY